MSHGGRAAAPGEREDAHAGLGLGPLTQDEGILERIESLNADARPMGHHLEPAVGGTPAVVRGGDDPEVLPGCR